jgi:RNA 3'-terminal phosphate cyclase (ATP)
MGRFMEPVLIDASDGGASFRTAIGLSALIGKPVRIGNIRAKRPNPGLQPQHLTALQVVSSMCGAQASGAKQGSSVVGFAPAKLRASRLSAGVGTAGSVLLVAQAAMLPMLAASTRLRVSGGTDVPFAPPFAFFPSVLFPALSRMGGRFEIELSARGYFPKGGGAVSLSSKPARFPLKPVVLVQPSDPDSLSCVSHCASLPADVASEQAVSAKKALSDLGVPFEQSLDVRSDARSKGSGISLFARLKSGAVVSGSALGDKGKPAKSVGLEAAKSNMNCRIGPERLSSPKRCM